MTTIAIRHGVLVTDGRVVTAGRITTETARKARVVKNVGILAHCGLLIDLQRFVHALKNGGTSHFKMDPQTAIILARPNGRVRVWEMDSTFVGHYDLSVTESHFLTWGSGGSIAAGAMAVSPSVSAHQAVSISAKLDAFTGGEIQAFDIEKLERI